MKWFNSNIYVVLHIFCTKAWVVVCPFNLRLFIKLLMLLLLTSAINEIYSSEELQGHVTKNNSGESRFDATKLEMFFSVQRQGMSVSKALSSISSWIRAAMDTFDMFVSVDWWNDSNCDNNCCWCVDTVEKIISKASRCTILIHCDYLHSAPI